MLLAVSTVFHTVNKEMQKSDCLLMVNANFFLADKPVDCPRIGSTVLQEKNKCLKDFFYHVSTLRITQT